jgi:hypothetical protein
MMASSSHWESSASRQVGAVQSRGARFLESLGGAESALKNIASEAEHAEARIGRGASTAERAEQEAEQHILNPHTEVLNLPAETRVNPQVRPPAVMPGAEDQVVTKDFIRKLTDGEWNAEERRFDRKTAVVLGLDIGPKTGNVTGIRRTERILEDLAARGPTEQRTAELLMGDTGYMGRLEREWIDGIHGKKQPIFVDVTDMTIGTTLQEKIQMAVDRAAGEIANKTFCYATDREMHLLSIKNALLDVTFVTRQADNTLLILKNPFSR